MKLRSIKDKVEQLSDLCKTADNIEFTKAHYNELLEKERTKSKDVKEFGESAEKRYSDVLDGCFYRLVEISSQISAIGKEIAEIKVIE